MTANKANKLKNFSGNIQADPGFSNAAQENISFLLRQKAMEVRG